MATEIMMILGQVCETMLIKKSDGMNKLRDFIRLALWELI